MIYHGSTKEESDIGKFGTGFLVTHLLSKIVNVRGLRDDGKEFKFDLARTGTSAGEMEELAERTWDEYLASLKPESAQTQNSAEYVYYLSDISKRTADEGLEALAQMAPYVLAFNQQLSTIEIGNNSETRTFELVPQKTPTNHPVRSIRERQTGKEDKLHELWIEAERRSRSCNSRREKSRYLQSSESR